MCICVPVCFYMCICVYIVSVNICSCVYVFMCAHVYIHQGTVALCIKIDYFYVYRMWQTADTLQYPFPLLLLLLFFFFMASPATYRILEIPGPGVKSELQLLAYVIATATLDPSCICNLCHGLWQHQILNPLGKGKDRTCILMETTLGP